MTDNEKTLLIDSLQIAAAQRSRTREKFKQGSAAWTEIHNEYTQIQAWITDIKAGKTTPLEQAIEKKK